MPCDIEGRKGIEWVPIDFTEAFQYYNL